MGVEAGYGQMCGLTVWWHMVTLDEENVVMTAGEGIKKGAEGTKPVTDRVVNAVEGKINDVTDMPGTGVRTAGTKAHGAVAQPRRETYLGTSKPKGTRPRSQRCGATFLNYGGGVSWVGDVPHCK